MSFIYYRSKTKRSYLKFILLLLLILAALIYAAVFIYRSPIFRYKIITAVDEKGFARNDLLADLNGSADFAWFNNIFPKEHFLHWLFVEVKKPKSAETAAIKKDYVVGNLTFIIREREKVGAWCFRKEDRCFWFDKSGLLFRDAPNSEGGLLLKINDIDRKSSDTERMDILIATFIKNIKEQMLRHNLFISGIDYSDDKKEVHVFSDNGPEIIIDWKDRPEASFYPYLDTILDTENIGKIEYLDFSVKNRVFIKHK